MAQAAIPIIIAAVGAAATIYSSVQQGKAQERASDRAAKLARSASDREAADTEKQHIRAIATQEAMYGKAGLTMEGSPLLVKQTSLRESEEQLRRIREGGSNLSSMYKTEGDEARTAGTVSAVGAGVKGAESVYKIGNDYDWFS